jgi:hypothetical protein
MSNINLEYRYIHIYLAGIDARSLKKPRDTLSLPVEARNDPCASSTSWEGSSGNGVYSKRVTVTTS